MMDENYSYLEDTTPNAEMIRKKLLERRALMGRNIAAMQPQAPIAGAGSIAPEAVRARALADYNRFGNGGVVLRQPPVAGGDPNADTPEDIARKAALSRMTMQGTKEASVAIDPEVSDRAVAMSNMFKANAQRRAHDNQRARDLAEEAATPAGKAAAEAIAARKQAAIEAFNKKNAERAYARGALTPGAYGLAASKGYLPPPDNGDSGSQVAWLNRHYNGNPPEHLLIPAMHNDAETKRRMYEAPDKAALAEAYRARVLADLTGALGPDHELVKKKIADFMGGPAVVAKPVVKAPVDPVTGTEKPSFARKMIRAMAKPNDPSLTPIIRDPFDMTPVPMY